MNAGDAFLKINEFCVRHLYIVISDPSQEDDVRFPNYVFLVMLSTNESYKENACVLKQGDHPFVKHDSVIVYKTPPAIFEHRQVLLNLIERQVLLPQSPVSDIILSRIRSGYVKSRYQKDSIYQFLFRQRLID